MHRTFFAFAAILAAASSSMGATSPSFGDRNFPEGVLELPAQAPAPLVVLDRMGSTEDAPLTLFSFSGDPLSVIINTLPIPALVPTNTMDKIAPLAGKGGSDQESKEFPRVVVIPLPAPAGLALAGLVFIAGVRRR